MGKLLFTTHYVYSAMQEKKGLEDVIAGQSSITFLDGHKAKMLYRGYDIGSIARESSFEEICYLLWHGELPKKGELDEFRAMMAKERDIPEGMKTMMREMPRTSPMEALRCLISVLSLYDPEANDNSPEADLRKAIRLTSKVATISANMQRIWLGQPFMNPSKEFSYSENFLYMLHGKKPSQDDARILDTCLILHADHEFNASTFAARIAASTLSDIYSAAVAAIATLKGPLHGGANEEVAKMLDDIGRLEKAESYIRNKLDTKGKIMGFGHRVYKTGDPRAPILKDFVKKMGESRKEGKWYDMSIKIEEMMFQEKKLYPNVDFYSASVFRMLGIDRRFFTLIFATGRMAGWTAHVMEQHADNRLIRPASDYIGHGERKYVPIEKR